jgi:hypothetical protein
MTNDDKTALRHIALRFFALRSTAAFTVVSAAHLLRVRKEADFAFENEDLEAACEFLVGLELLKKYPDDLGSTMYYQATSKGVLSHERGGA